jgi:hypothetical protein
MRSRRGFERYNMFAEAFHSTIKGIHVALEVKTSFDNSTPTAENRGDRGITVHGGIGQIRQLASSQGVGEEC